ncbi:MAG TPA: PP2C family protein-serine/threonine phosphatase [Marmoricola sp.]|nr:PP2C family protein-serine/threonine phosphatase [Marmoricola sp.]
MSRARLRPSSLVVVAAVVAITVVLSWAAWAANRASNDRLLGLQVRQTASVLQNQIAVISAQMLDAAQAAEDTDANPAIFRRFVSGKISTDGPFASITLWRLTSGDRQLVTTVGGPPVISDEVADRFFATVKPSPAPFVTPVLAGGPAGSTSDKPRFGYAVQAPGDTKGYVVYAERFLPPQRRISVPPTSPFAGLHLAVYLGRSAQESQLLEATAPTPIQGHTRTDTVPFGNSALTVVGSSPQQLTGQLSAALPWIVLFLGAALALGAGATVEYVGRKRALAERLAEENERLFHEQRDIAGTLQHALLPELPTGRTGADDRALEIAARYLPGVSGTEVGGDWYDVVPDENDPQRCVFVVGDISGRGLAAATSMAGLRFAIRAYLAQGDDIATVLAKLDRLLPFEDRHQFATVLVGALDLRAGRLQLVSAGHFAPLLVTAEGAAFLECPVRPPVGVERVPPTPVSLDLSGPATLVAFTDGLVERPGEVLDVGLERLRAAAGPSSEGDGPLEELINRLTRAAIPDGTDDDAVILALRWAGVGAGAGAADRGRGWDA